MAVVVVEPSEVDGADGRPSTPAVVARVLAAPLAAHLLAFVLLLGALAPFVRVGTAWTTDEGAYGLEQRSLAHGDYAFPWSGRGVDPALRWYPIVNGSSGTRGTFPYVAHPAYPWVQHQLARALGETGGLVALPLLGAIGTAVAAWLLAGLLDERARPVAFWMAALSPVLLNGWVAWAHAPAAALAGLALYCVLRAAGVANRDEPISVCARWMTVAAVVVVTGALVRSEMVLFAAGLAVAFGALVWRRRPVHAGVGAAMLAGSAAATMLIEARWRASIVGAPAAVTVVRQAGDSLVGGRLSGAWHSLLSAGFGNTLLDCLMLGAVVVAVVASAAVATGRPGAVRHLCASVVLIVVGYGVHLAVAPSNPVTGLLPAVPGVLACLAAVWTRRQPPAVPGVAVAMSAVVGVLAVGVLATQYADGGGLEWGGRFFAPALAPLAALAAVGAGRLLGAAASSARTRGAVAASVVALVLVPAAASIVVLRSLRGDVAAIGRDVVRPGVTTVITDSHALPRNEWRTHDRITWYRVPPSEVAEALDALRGAGVANVLVVEPRAVETDVRRHAVRVDRLRAPSVDRTAWSVLDVDLR